MITISDENDNGNPSGDSKNSNKTLISELRIKRGVVQTQQTKMKTFIETPGRNLSQFELQTRLNLLENYLCRFEEIQSNLEILDEDEPKSDKRELYEQNYISIKSKISELLNPRQLTRSSTLLDNTMTLSANSNKKNVRLQRLNIKKFSGNIVDWPDFYALFKVLVEDNADLTKIEKLSYLIHSLEDRALKTVSNLNLESDFDNAITLLKERFNNKRLIFQTHIQNLFDFPKLEKSSSEKLRTLIDSVKSSIRALNSSATQEQIADGFLLQLLRYKLDSSTVTKWEEMADINKIPTWEEFSKFLEKRCQALEMSDYSKASSNKVAVSNNVKSTFRKSSYAATSSRLCQYCKMDHYIHECEQFQNLSVMDRFYNVKNLKLCILCLKGGHTVKNCRGPYCALCNMKHHSLLHRSSQNNSSQTSQLTANTTDTVDNASVMSKGSSYTSQMEISHSELRSGTFLATALVNVRNSSGDLFSCRALLDSGSSLHFVTEHLAQILRLKKVKTELDIMGIGATNTKVKRKVQLSIESTKYDYKATLEALVLPKITDDQPGNFVSIHDWKIPKNIKLADPAFNIPNSIDMLIGAELFFDMLAVGQIRLGINLPILQKTLLGWIISGGTQSRLQSLTATCLPADEIHLEKLNEQVKKFWSLEEFDTSKKALSAEELACEEHFLTTLKIQPNGRFALKLPFKKSPNVLGDSLDIAKKRFFSLENKLSRMPEIKTQYTDFINEYVTLGHMQEISFNNLNKGHYIIPHHAVLKPDSSSTKLRVVFDGSCKTTTGYSLNDILMVGPVVQEDLFTTLLAFRSNKYAITADICKMYRQCDLDAFDRNFQCILWRDSPNEVLKLFQLNTVTYGLAPSSFQATRCLKYLADKNHHKFPLASNVIAKNFYVDDMLAGADTFDEAKKIMEEVTSVLKSGGFELSKWASNSKELLKGIDDTKLEKLICRDEEDFIKTLGMFWQPGTDEFRYFYHPTQKYINKATKRLILSEISRLFDPIGLLNPIVVKAKMLLQNLWTLNLEWDEAIPQNLHCEWNLLLKQLELVKNIKIPRHVLHRAATIQLHGFADASSSAYGCCIYVRYTLQGSVSCNLLTAKSRVAPIKTTSIPRLELCAALLLAELMNKVNAMFEKDVEKVTCWSDSSIVLHWISSPSSKWSVFVSNRVAKIQNSSGNFSWKHVSTEKNPADIISRGCFPCDLIDNQMWFKGPSFLLEPEEKWPDPVMKLNMEVPEKRKTKIALVLSEENDLINSSKFINSYTKLINTFVYVYRFYNNCKIKFKSDRATGPIKINEFNFALKIVIRFVQKKELFEEYNLLLKKRDLKNSSNIKNLCPFLDTNGIIRVGGRLQNANIDFDSKHPIVLPKSKFAKSLISFYHSRNLHAGTQTLLSIIRTRFWPVGGKNAVKQAIFKCIKCYRARPQANQQLMGQLPASRVQPSPVFYNTGVDFFGPFFVKTGIRGRTLIKTYMCIFICFAVKAVHIEVAMNLTTEAFLSILTKFISRRPFVSKIYSDNATNFVGARRKLDELRHLFINERHSELVHQLCKNDGIEWINIPPKSPNFGGLWEASIKQAKILISRSFGSSSYTMDELQRIACQVESILNSRPLIPQSNNPQDFEVLTPGHFLVGGHMKAILTPNYEYETKHLDRWQSIQSKIQNFWKTWQNQYLQSLQIRYKWYELKHDVMVGSIVLLREENTPPLKWPLGRITRVHKGADGLVRVVDIRTQNGTYTRAISKICILPITSETENNSLEAEASKVAGYVKFT